MSKRVQKREDYKNLIDEYFWQFYRLNKTVKPKKYNTRQGCYEGARSIFSTMQEMMSESTHGMIIKDFGIIVPKDSVIEVKEGLFKKESKILSKYLFFFEKEWLSDYYRTYYLSSPSHKQKTEVVREPKPYAIALHRKKIRKD